MKATAIKLMTLSDLMKFNHYVKTNHIKGTLVQRDYKADVRNTFSILLALPLDNAELIEEN